MEIQETHVAEIILKNQNKDEGLTLPSFKSYYKVTELKTVWYWHKIDIYIKGIELMSQK